MKLETAFKSRCEAIAVEWRNRFGLRVIDPLPADVLLKGIDPNVEVLTPDQIPNFPLQQVDSLAQAGDWSAGIIRRDPLLILIHPAHQGARRESNLMHEVGHLLLDHPMIGFSPETRLP